jgi:hypothetical protein
VARSASAAIAASRSRTTPRNERPGAMRTSLSPHGGRDAAPTADTAPCAIAPAPRSSVVPATAAAPQRRPRPRTTAPAESEGEGQPSPHARSGEQEESDPWPARVCFLGRCGRQCRAGPRAPRSSKAIEQLNGSALALLPSERQLRVLTRRATDGARRRAHDGVGRAHPDRLTAGAHELRRAPAPPRARHRRALATLADARMMLGALDAVSTHVGLMLGFMPTLDLRPTCRAASDQGAVDAGNERARARRHGCQRV